MGFRSSDICNLRISDISWQERTISIVQQKTGVPLKLPFPVEVGNTLVKYILYGRPVCNIPNVFTSLNHPYKKIDKTRCYYITRMILGEKKFPEDIRGLHVLRKTFASNLLVANNPVSLISTTLGHTYEGAVETYLATNEQQMRLCSIGLTGIEIEEVSI
jgi:integrase